MLSECGLGKVVVSEVSKKQPARPEDMPYALTLNFCNFCIIFWEDLVFFIGGSECTMQGRT